MGLDLFPSGAVTAAVLSLYPRLDKAGYVPRKSIESEPLLEHGLALGVALVDAISLVRALALQVDCTRQAGMPLLVFNPLNQSRRQLAVGLEGRRELPEQVALGRGKRALVETVGVQAIERRERKVDRLGSLLGLRVRSDEEGAGL